MKRHLPYVLIGLASMAVTFYLTTRPMDPDEAVRQVLAADPHAEGAAGQCQQAVDDLVAAGPDALPTAVAAIPDVAVMDDLIKADWLRSACDRIVDDAKHSGEPLPTDELLLIAMDAERPGNARRKALEIVREIDPEAIDADRHAWLDDPVFFPDRLRENQLPLAGVGGGRVPPN